MHLTKRVLNPQKLFLKVPPRPPEVLMADAAHQGARLRSRFPPNGYSPPAMFLEILIPCQVCLIELTLFLFYFVVLFT